MGKETTSAGQGAVLLTVLGAASQLLGVQNPPGSAVASGAAGEGEGA